MADETIKTLLQQATQGVQDGLNGIDAAAIAAAVTPHLQTAGEAVLAKVGEAEAVSYTFRDTVYTMKTPINMTTKEIVVLALGLIKDIISEEAMAPVVARFDGLSAESIEQTIQQIQETPDEELPVTDIGLYSNEEGAVLFDLNMSRDGEAVIIQTGIAGQKMIVYVDALSQAVIDMDIDMDTGVMKISAAFNADGMKVGLDLTLEIGADLKAELALSLNDMNVITLTGKLEMGGTITASYDTEGKTEAKFESLMSGDISTSDALVNDIQSSLMGILIKAMSIMPDEIGALTGTGN